MITIAQARRHESELEAAARALNLRIIAAASDGLVIEATLLDLHEVEKFGPVPRVQIAARVAIADIKWEEEPSS